MDISSSKECGADLLRLDFLATFASETENIFVIRNGFVEGFNGDAEVVDFSNHREACGCELGKIMANFEELTPQEVAKATRILSKWRCGEEMMRASEGESPEDSIFRVVIRGHAEDRARTNEKRDGFGMVNRRIGMVNR